MADTCLIVANPISGLGFGRRNAPRLEERLRESGYDVELIWTTESNTAREAAAAADPSQVAAILCVGGDGTLNQVVNGLGDKRIPVTIFPTGTGNVLAKEYGIPYSVPRVCDMIRRGKIELLDAGVIGGQRFVLFAGAGFDAAVAMALSESLYGVTMEQAGCSKVVQVSFREASDIVDDDGPGGSTPPPDPAADPDRGSGEGSDGGDGGDTTSDVTPNSATAV